MNSQIVDLSTSAETLRNRVGDAGRWAWAPPPSLTPSEWAERNIKIPAGNAIPGYIRFDNAPYQREPLDMVANPAVRRITLMWGAQTGKTQVMTCGIGYNIAQTPCSQMVMQPAQGDLQTWLETKFNPFVEANETLTNRIAKPRGRNGVNNQLMKSYPGGWLMFAWSGSTRTMRGRSAPKIWCDEVDGYERTDEGDAVELLFQRAATFGDQRLLVETSTPTIKGGSSIETAFEMGDQRRYHIPCPHCSEMQTLKWSQVEWDKDAQGNHLPETARYVCEHCKGLINDGHKRAALRRGCWVAAKPFTGHVSYHLSELYSAFRKWRDIVQSFLDKKHKGDLQSFVNVSLAETWEQEGQKVEHSGLFARREHYQAEVPPGALVLVCGVDVQDDRIEGEIIAYGLGHESWGVDEFILHGDPGRPVLWEQLNQRLLKPYKNQHDQPMGIVATCIDSGGHYTQQVYEFCKKHAHRRVWAVKGSNEKGRPVIAHESKNNKVGVRLFTLGTDTIKELIFSRLKIEHPGPGYCHFPVKYDEEFFLQLTAEKRIKKFKAGQATYEWIKTRPRNEALDRRVYALAALTILNPVFEVLAKQAPTETPKPKRKAPEPTPEKPEDRAMVQHKQKSLIRNRTKKGFVNSWR